MSSESREGLQQRIEELENRLEEQGQMIEAIQNGEVDAFAIKKGDRSEVYTLQSGDYAYRLLIEEFGEGAVNISEDGLIVYTNKYFINLVAKPYDKIVGTFFAELIHPDYRIFFGELISQAKLGKSKGEICLEINDKSIPIYISLTSLRPHLETVAMIITDLSDKKKQEQVIAQYQKDLELTNEELLHSNAELASFAYIASHDLQEPLRKIQTFSNRLLEKEHQNFSESAKDYFNRISAASSRMQNLIDALLNYSRLATSQVEFIKTDLNNTLEEVKTNLNEIITETGASIKADALPELYVIPHQFVQLFSNIILNAIKYRKPGEKPAITIKVKMVKLPATHKLPQPQSDPYWEIAIADYGIGFDQVYADRIFELFQRLHGKKEYDGTGIGLAICKRIVQNHGGMIKATGQSGKELSFFFIYQLAKKIMKHKRILLVDDDDDDQLNFKDAIQDVSPETECLIANNGLEALDFLQKNGEDLSLIFLDLNMPKMNGFECLEQLRNDETLNQIPVVIFSTSDNPIDRRLSLESGAKRFITKTPDFGSLKSKIREMLQADL